MSDQPVNDPTQASIDDTELIENLELLMDLEIIENEGDWDTITELNNKEIDSTPTETKSED